MTFGQEDRERGVQMWPSPSTTQGGKEACAPLHSCHPDPLFSPSSESGEVESLLWQ